MGRGGLMRGLFTSAECIRFLIHIERIFIGLPSSYTCRTALMIRFEAVEQLVLRNIVYMMCIELLWKS